MGREGFDCLKLVRVDWMDAFGGVREGWRGIADVRDRKTTPAISVGYLAKEGPDKIVIIPHFVSADEKDVDFTTCSADGEISIPLDWVRSIVELRPVRQRKPKTPLST